MPNGLASQTAAALFTKIHEQSLHQNSKDLSNENRHIPGQSSIPFPVDVAITAEAE